MRFACLTSSGWAKGSTWSPSCLGGGSWILLLYTVVNQWPDHWKTHGASKKTKNCFSFRWTEKNNSLDLEKLKKKNSFGRWKHSDFEAYCASSRPSTEPYRSLKPMRNGKSLNDINGKLVESLCASEVLFLWMSVWPINYHAIGFSHTPYCCESFMSLTVSIFDVIFQFPPQESHSRSLGSSTEPEQALGRNGPSVCGKEMFCTVKNGRLSNLFKGDLTLL